MNLKVSHISFSDIGGGAARAAYRIHHSLRKSGVDSHMYVCKPQSGDWTVKYGKKKRDKIFIIFREQLGRFFSNFLKAKGAALHSPAFLNSNLVSKINKSDCDLVHLHWISGEMISISDISCIKKPIVWTLHDMWAFCGAEHYAEDERWKTGYFKENRPSNELGFDLNRWTWKRKYRKWKKPIQIVAPSKWLTNCAKESALMKAWPIAHIPYSLDLSVWKPIEKKLAKDILNLPDDKFIILFGAVGGTQNPRKGFDLLKAALEFLKNKDIKNIELLVFGELEPEFGNNFEYPVHYTGRLNDDTSLRVLYSAADIFALPSRQDNLPLTGMESLACGTPVIGFNVTGIPDIIKHKKTGYLASPFSHSDFAEGIIWAMSEYNSSKSNLDLSLNCRNYAVNHFSELMVSMSYINIYNRLKNNIKSNQS
jgi:glycosyltransferase involved in cell wall biosynthesis